MFDMFIYLNTTGKGQMEVEMEMMMMITLTLLPCCLWLSLTRSRH